MSQEPFEMRVCYKIVTDLTLEAHTNSCFKQNKTISRIN